MAFNTVETVRKPVVKTGKGISIRRNELIADLFCRLHKVERAGTGIQRMRKSLASAGLQEPEFEINGFFRTVFHRSPEFSLKAPRKTTEKTTEKIIALIKLNPNITTGELATKTGLSTDGINWDKLEPKKT